MSEISPIRKSIRTDSIRTGGSGLKGIGGLWGELLAEFLGTFVLIAFGDGVGGHGGGRAARLRPRTDARRRSSWPPATGC